MKVENKNSSAHSQLDRQPERRIDTKTDSETNWINGWKLENNVDIINYSLNHYNSNENKTITAK